MKRFIFNALCLLPGVAMAQLYTDATANLPASASGANMDVRALGFQPNFLLKNNGATSRRSAPRRGLRLRVARC